MRLTGWAEEAQEREGVQTQVTRWGDSKEALPGAGQCDSVLVDPGAAHVAWDGRRGHGLLGSERAHVLPFVCQGRAHLGSLC